MSQIWLSFAFCGVAWPAVNFSAPVVTVEPPGFHSIGLVVTHGDDDNRNARIAVRYRVPGGSWRAAQPLFRVPVERVTWKTLERQFAGSVFDLRPGAAYEFELTIQDPDGYTGVHLASARTRALPAPPLNPRQVSVSTPAQLSAAAAAARPGDIITVAAGVYPVESLQFLTGGTPENPIVLRGASAAGSILDGGNCVCNILEVYGGHVRVENLTFRNAQQAMRFYGATEGIVVTRNRFADVDRGINSQPGQSGFLIADNIIEGRLRFQRPFGPIADSYAMQIYGSHHILAHNEIRGFMDGIRLFGGGNRNVDIYGNDIVWGADDGIEADAAERNVRIYRNRIANIDSGISTQPAAGGPVYFLRNLILNPRNEQFKLHGTGGGRLPSGVLAYHNTAIGPAAALQMFSSQAAYNFEFRNNAFHGAVPPGAPVVAWDGPIFQGVFNTNGYYPDRYSYWNNGGQYVSYASLAALFAGGLFEQSGRALAADAFLSGKTGGGLDEYWPPQLPLPRPSRNLLAGAAPLANINDNSPGGPDLGALESGCPPPHYGPRPAGIDERNSVLGCESPLAPANASPVAQSIAIATASGSARTYKARVTDANGFADVENVTLILGGSGARADGCAVTLGRSREELYLWNESGTARSGPIAAGRTGTLENSRCVLNGAASSVRYQSDTQSVEWTAAVTFKSGFSVPASLYLQAEDLSAQPSAPLAVSIAVPAPLEPSPAGGSGLAQTFQFRFQSPAGWSDLGVVNVLINSAIDGRAACYLAFVPATASSGALYLVDDQGNSGGPYAGMTLPGTSAIENSQCRIAAAGSTVSASGNTLTLTLALSFKGSFAGNKVLYSAARAKTAANSGWVPLGTWAVPGPAPTGPVVNSLSPARASSRAQTFTLSVSSPAGWTDITVVNLLINSSLDGRNACYLAFAPGPAGAGVWYLVGDAGDPAAALLSLPIPGGGAIANHQCSLAGAGATAAASGNTLTLNVPLTFLPAFTGNMVVYGAARGRTQNSGWQAVGSILLP